MSAGNRLLVIDTETGGFDPLKRSILSIGAVVWDDGEMLDEIEILIAERPMKTDPEAIKVNKIDLSHHESVGLTPKRATTVLEGFTRKYFPEGKIPLAGHNLPFDIGFLQRLYRLAKKDYEQQFSHRSLDTSTIMTFLRLANRLPVTSSSLDSSLRYFDIKINVQERHSALGDARGTAELLTKLVALVRGMP